MSATSQPPIEIFKALSDPIRWNIIVQMASVDELACVALEDTLPISKPTISYHTKILYQAGLINVRKSGRNYFYSLRREVLHELLDDLWELAPAQRPAVREEDGRAVSGPVRNRPGAPEDVEEAVVLTW
jgi:DNA-binding transcriptional ArsR family regulator